ncbi:MAG TPA: 3-dehydroquinate synthase [Bacteroidia bacterium]|jgi:3-dehydroquinate synthase|nr:3-dehydroquinate synthase [Bacteroidia bacterium]
MGSPFSTIVTSGYSIQIGNSALDQLNAFLKKNKFSSLFILVDENSLRHCLPTLIANVKKLSEAEVIEVESGEKNKTLEVCTNIWRALGELGADRNSLLVNLGGGVITDMGGFIAAAYKRGMAFVNVPTTLLAQVDASVGGKTGVDLDGLKNQVGFFAEPQEVFIYPPFLRTLSKREMLSGFAEVLKHALIADADYWNFLKDINLADASDWDEIILRSVNIKNEIVKQDPQEKNIRKTLNFGHTVGHAIETYFLEHAQTLLHGEAVAIGMICEAWLSVRHGGLEESKMEEIASIIHRSFGLHSIDTTAYHRIIELMRHDKKNEKGSINLTLLKDIGVPVINKRADASEIMESLDHYRVSAMQNKN